jgi:hypothetical protein
MSVAPAAAADISLAVSWLLVTRLERAGERLGLSEACWAWWRRSRRTRLR